MRDRGRQAGQLLPRSLHTGQGNERSQDLIRPLEDSIDPTVAQPTLVGVFLHVAVARPDLEVLIDTLPSNLATEDLRDRALERVIHISAVDQVRGETYDALCGIGVDHHAANLLLDHTELADLLLELHALVAMEHGRFDRTLAGSHRSSRKPHAAVIEHAHGNLEPRTDTADDILNRYLHVLVIDLMRPRSANAELMHRSADRDSLGRKFESEGTHLVFLLSVLDHFSLGEDSHERRNAGIGDPELAAIEDVVLAVRRKRRTRLDRCGVRSGAWLREAVTSHELTRSQPGQEALLLLIIAEEKKCLVADALVRTDRYGERTIDARDFFHDARVRLLLKPESAKLLGDGHAHQAELRHVGYDLARHRTLLIPLC